MDRWRETVVILGVYLLGLVIGAWFMYDYMTP